MCASIMNTPIILMFAIPIPIPPRIVLHLTELLFTQNPTPLETPSKVKLSKKLTHKPPTSYYFEYPLPLALPLLALFSIRLQLKYFTPHTHTHTPTLPRSWRHYMARNLPPHLNYPICPGLPSHQNILCVELATMFVAIHFTKYHATHSYIFTTQTQLHLPYPQPPPTCLLPT